MQPKKQKEEVDLFRSHLEQILNHKHPLYELAGRINWECFEQAFGPTYVEDVGRPGIPVRLMVGLHYLKHSFDESDESVVERFIENPYWQYFCGMEYFQHRVPIDASSLTRFRDRIGESGIELMFRGLLETAKRGGHLKESQVQRVNVDTTVQEKAIAFPTDARLYYKMRAALVRAAQARGIELRQSYRRIAKSVLAQQGRYAHARQMKRARKMTKKLKTMLGCVYRDMKRKVGAVDEELGELFGLADRLLGQQKESKNKLYSVHAPEVECISKGKAHKRYEFGNKVGMVTTSRGNWIVGIQAFHGNPYDGHTLTCCLEQVKRLTGWSMKEAYVDLGYRGHGYQGETTVHIVNYRTMKKLTRAVRRWFKRRSAIEPIFGHVKAEHRMARNYLKGVEGDRMNALLCGCGFNMRKLLAVFFLPHFLWHQWRLLMLSIEDRLECRRVWVLCSHQ
jgi:transposase, IS5 family